MHDGLLGSYKPKVQDQNQGASGSPDGYTPIKRPEERVVPAKKQSFSQYVNPFIGTGGHGHTFPGATVPFGMVQLSPDTRIDGSWDGCSGYHYSDSIVYGFSHTHLSGTGVSDYGDVMIMPYDGNLDLQEEAYVSKFSHSNESAGAGYYAVQLDDHDVQVELTSTQRVGFHRYTYSETNVNVLLNLQHRDKLIDHKILKVRDNMVTGFRRSSAWAVDQHVYFAMEFSKPISDLIANEDESIAGFSFELDQSKQLLVKVGISFVSVEGALANLQDELWHWDFDMVKRNAAKLWDKELSKIEVFTGDEEKKNIFYTALYHCMIHPNIAEDVDGKYRGHDGKIHESPDHTHYTVFSLWDTYRALHPLLTIIDEERTTDFIKTFLEIYKQSGRLPVWELASNETDCMIGYHSVSVIADAYMKGIRGFDTTLALEAMVASANEDIFGLPSYRKYGFVRAEDEPESVSKTLEYAYDDWCISQMAREMGEDSIARVFRKRAESWRNIINPETGFATPRLNGDWLKDFDPREVNLHFTEANSWQYSFVQHKSSFYFSQNEKRLDALFSEKEKTTGRTQSDITGLIGQYAHGNEPSHHIAYLYNYTAHPEKGLKIIKQICDSFYTNTPDGLIGNEDCGQMSAWYVLSSTGIYQIAPGSNEFLTSESLFDSVKYQLSNGRLFEISTAPYVDYNCCYPKKVSWDQLQNGFSLVFGGERGFDSAEVSVVDMHEVFCQTPLIKGNMIFEGESNVKIESLNKLHSIYYFLDDDTSNLKLFSEPISINETTKISAFAESYFMTYFDGYTEFDSMIRSPTITSAFYKKPNNWTCTPSILPNS
ncbi:MAG: GH92 family glycosyl hydrolase, partial [Bacteroidia bacterium]